MSRPLPPLPLVYDDKLAPNGALLFDNSTLELIRCPRLLQHKWLDKRELVANKAGRNFGSGLHIGWAERYRRAGSKQVTPDVFAAQCEAMREFFDASPPPGEDFRNFDHACRVMQEYNHTFVSEPFEILKNPRTQQPIVEAAFCLPFDGFEIDGHPVYYCGKIDTAIRDDSGIWSFDHKTTFQFGDTFDKQMSRDGGQMGYMWALWQVLGTRPMGYLINEVRIRKPGGRKAEYMELSCVDASDFKRVPFAKPDDTEVEGWKRDVRTIITQIIGFHKAGYFPEYRWNCTGKFGACDFYEVCSCPPAQREGVLFHTHLYEEATWSPLNVAKQESEKTK